MRQFSIENTLSCSLNVDNVSENVSPSESPIHASSHLLPNTSLIPKTSNRCSNSVNSPTSLSVFSVQSPTHTSVSPVQSPSHTPSITSPVIPSTQVMLIHQCLLFVKIPVAHVKLHYPLLELSPPVLAMQTYICTRGS